MNALPVVPVAGLRADSLGTYLASLGLFSLVARKWPTARACWRNASFLIVGGPIALDEVVEFVNEIGKENRWTKYDRPWDKDKQADVKKKVSTQTALWRAVYAEERSLRSFGAHLALDGRVRMNPLLGKGGSTGNRNFAKGLSAAVQDIEKPPRKTDRDALKDDLKAFLSGGSCAYLKPFNAGSWFGTANKIYNHGNPSAPLHSPRGKKQPYREGEITPWAMAMACEGLAYFAGAPSRQLGGRRQPKGAFPFITSAMAPKGENEAGGIEAEVWAPIWNQPMTEPELRSLFLRGRAELGGKGATSSVAFAVGVASRGVDAGISEFRRFLLLRTTSAQTFESRMATVVPVPGMNPDSATTRALRSIVEFHDKLPEDRKVGERWRFSGLRGPLEQALVDFAAMVPSGAATEQAWALADEMLEALVKVDRNRTFRRHNVRFQLLPGEWAARLLREDPPDREARLALAISSLAETPTCPQFIAHRVGVWKGKPGSRWEFPESLPTQRVWSDVELTENLCAVAERRILETLRTASSQPPFDSAIRVGLQDVHAWLSCDLDEGRLRLWLNRFCMFDWSGEAARESQRSFPSTEQPAVDGALALHALFRPLVSDWLFRQVLQESDIRTERTSTRAHLGRVIAMLRHGDTSASAEVALAAYHSAGLALADFTVLPGVPDPNRLLAALIIPVRDQQVLAVFRRWRAPTEPKKQ